MSSDTIAVELPAPLVARLKSAADLAHRSVEDLAASTLESLLPDDPALPPEVSDELAAMNVFSDEALWAAAEPSFSPSEEYRLGQLNSVAGERDLTSAERSEQEALIASYRRSVVRRAKALAILARRGHRVPMHATAEEGFDGRHNVTRYDSVSLRSRTR